MSVYFAQGQTSSLVKIGSACWAPGRLIGVSVAAKEEMELLAECEGDAGLERRFHSYLERHWDHGEWFRPAPEVMGVIDEVKAGVFDRSRLPLKGWEISKPWQTKASIAHHGKIPGRVSYGEYRKIVPRLTHGAQKLPVPA